MEVSCFGLLSPPSQQRRAIFRTFNVQNSRPPPPSRLAFIFICDSSSWISSDATNPTSSTSDHPTKLSALQFSWADQSRDGRASSPSKTRPPITSRSINFTFFFSGVNLGRLFDPFRLKHFLPPCPVPSNLSPLAVPTLRPGWPLICRLDP